mgnify:CR=1 FL=1
MRIKNFKRAKNRAIRAITLCVLSSIFILEILKYQSAMAVLGVAMFTVSFYFIFKNEKMIDLVHSRKYRFSFLRQLFNFENFIYMKLPLSLRRFSIEFSVILIIVIFSIIAKEILFLIISIPLLIILSLIYR